MREGSLAAVRSTGTVSRGTSTPRRSSHGTRRRRDNCEKTAVDPRVRSRAHERLRRARRARIGAALGSADAASHLARLDGRGYERILYVLQLIVRGAVFVERATDIGHA
jgi:hypothetical protein